MNEEKEKTEAAGTEDILLYTPHHDGPSGEAAIRENSDRESGGAETPELPEKELPLPEEAADAPENRKPEEQDPETGRTAFPGKGRDLSAEYAELVLAHPELVGNGIPNDIFEEMKSSERPVLSVYDACMLRKQTDRISRLEAELAQLRRNAETAARAPVTGTSGGSVPEEETEDPFIRAFRDYR